MKTIEERDLSRAEYAYKKLRDGIRSGEYRPGQRLREAELATQLAVSRTPIREAIRRLASDGLIEVAPSRGMMIIELGKQQVRELYALRKVLEGAAAGMAAQHASPSELADMRGLIKRMNGASKNPAEVARMNRLFHATIHEAAHNHYLAQALSQLSDSLALLPRTTFEVRGRTEEARKEHLAMLEAIERRAPEEAERLARKHIENAGAARIRMMFEAS